MFWVKELKSYMNKIYYMIITNVNTRNYQITHGTFCTTDEKGFKSGRFDVNEDCMVFAASDALAHYILLMYMVANKENMKKNWIRL